MLFDDGLNLKPRARTRFNSLLKAGNDGKYVEIERSKYKPEHCDEVIRMASAGYSFRAFCGHIGITYRTGVAWRAQLPEFDEACRAAEMKRHLFYEHTAISNLKNKDFNHALFKSLTMSIVKWRDGHNTQVNINTESDYFIENVEIKPNLLTAEERREKIKTLAAELDIDAKRD